MTDEDIIKLWPQARGELVGFSRYLEDRGKAKITADQIRLAVLMSDREYQRLTTATTKKD